MKPFFRASIITLALVASLYGEYWQQAVKYDMHVKLDTSSHTLTVRSDLTYINHSPDALNEIYMQLYHNAFNEGTIAQEVWKNYGDGFPEDKGWTGIQIDQVKMDEQDLSFLIRDDTILDITLSHALEPGDTLHFSIDYTHIIHPHIDRSGFKGDQYDFAQWYPKFVVYDENGWHDDPFGDWGEFYGEFGDFKVTLDVPASFIVGASGVPIAGDPGWEMVRVDTSQSFGDWFEGFHEQNMEYRESLADSARRVVTFLAENVHDFAWAASPDFLYEHDSWEDFDVHVLYPPHVGADWTVDVAEDGAQALEWLSTKFGMYPWPQMTIVKGLISGGMEYPMLIMDGSDSESLIVHEIGHNWFYGILGNDELDEAWLDEGFTTFQTRWYLETQYPDNGYEITRNRITPFEEKNLQRQMYQEADFKPLLRYINTPGNEPLATKSYQFLTSHSYWLNVYDKGSYLLQVLKNYLGEERFLAGMQLYYERWALKHVNAKRFIDAMEDASGEELDWLFDQWLYTTNHTDYSLECVKTETLDDGQYRTHIHMKNKGGLFVPITARLIGPEGQVRDVQLEEFKFRSAPTIDVITPFNPQRVILDPNNIFFDTDLRNNDSKRKRAWRYDYKGWDAYPADRNLYLWKPMFGYGDEAGLGLGLQVKQVYRNTGDYLIMAGDLNSGTGKLDLQASFRKTHLGLPIGAAWLGKFYHWRETEYASLGYELQFSERYDTNPIHYITVQVDHAESRLGLAGYDPNQSHTRTGFKYEYQNYLWGGNHGMSVESMGSLGAITGNWLQFAQLNAMNNWSRNFKSLKLTNRSNLLLSSMYTPGIFRHRLGSQNQMKSYLDRVSSSLGSIDALEAVGDAYYLAGGGRMRGFTGDEDLFAHYIWSNNLDVVFHDRYIRSQAFAVSGFLDFGQYSSDRENWESMLDYGFGVELKSSWKRTSWLTTLIRPVTFKIQVPLGRYHADEFEHLGQTWLFSISN